MVFGGAKKARLILCLVVHGGSGWNRLLIRGSSVGLLTSLRLADVEASFPALDFHSQEGQQMFYVLSRRTLTARGSGARSKALLFEPIDNNVARYHL